MIVAMTLERGIGKNNDLLCYIESDLKYFKSKTLNKVVIMGRKTYESLPNGPLRGRVNIVMSKTRSFLHDDVIVKKSKKDVLKYIDNYHKEDEVFVIGGESIYKEFIDDVDNIYITYYMNDYPADTFFPDFKHKFKIVELKRTHPNLIPKEQERMPHVYTVYKKIL